MRAPPAARAAFVSTTAAALLLALLARPAAAQSQAVQVPCNLQGANVTVSQSSGLFCGYTFSFPNNFGGTSASMTCYDSVQPVVTVSMGGNIAQLPVKGIVFKDYLLCTPPSVMPANPPFGPSCRFANYNFSYIVYIAIEEPSGFSC